MKKTMLYALIAFFTMLICARFASGQTETQETDQKTKSSAKEQPGWCNEACVTVPVIDGEGYIKAVKKAAHAGSLNIEPYQFTKLKHEDGSNIKPGDAPKRGEILFLSDDDINTPPQSAVVAEFFAAERAKTATVVTVTEKAEAETAQLPATSDNDSIVPAAPVTDYNGTEPKRATPKPPEQPTLFIQPSKTAIILTDPAFFFAILSLSCTFSILFILARCFIQGGTNREEPRAVSATNLQMPGKGILGIFPQTPTTD